MPFFPKCIDMFTMMLYFKISESDIIFFKGKPIKKKTLFESKKLSSKIKKNFLANQKNFFPIKKKLSLPVYRQA